MNAQRRGLTIVECLVSLVASSVILGGLLGLYSVADTAARNNSSDIYGTSMDYNLDRVLSEIAATTANSTFNPTRRSFSAPGPNGDNAPFGNSPNQYLVYERPRRIVPTPYWTVAQGGAGQVVPPAMPQYRDHPLPVIRDGNNVNNFVNIDLRRVDASGYPFSDNWLTGIVALYRRDPYDSDGNGTLDRFRTGILWQIEMPMPRMQDYGLIANSAGGSFCQSGSEPGVAFSLDAATVGGIVNSDNPHLRFAGARILAVNVQSFKIDSRDPMTWQVTR